MEAKSNRVDARPPYQSTIIIPCLPFMAEAEREELKRRWLETYKGPRPVEIITQEMAWPPPANC